MNINEISKMMPAYTSQTKNKGMEDKAKIFEDLLEKAITKEDEKKMKDAARQFESYFINQLFQEMRKTIPKDGILEESHGTEIFQGMLDEQYAEELSKAGGIGLADMMYKQMMKDSENMYKIKK